MTRIQKFKENIEEGERSFFEEYENSIREFVDKLQEEDLLLDNYTDEKIDRIKKFIKSSNAAAYLYRNFNKIITSDTQQTNSNIEKLKDFGLDVNTIADQYASVMCHMYQVMGERLKLHLITLVDFPKLGLENADKIPLGPILNKLQNKFPENEFIQSLNTKMRNSVAHYTYYFQNGMLHLCNGYFDSEPTQLSIQDFMKESKEYNLLVEGLFIISLDKLRPCGDLILDQ